MRYFESYFLFSKQLQCLDTLLGLQKSWMTAFVGEIIDMAILFPVSIDCVGSLIKVVSDILRASQNVLLLLSSK